MYILKVQSLPSKDQKDESKRLENLREDCPLDKDELGML